MLFIIHILITSIYKTIIVFIKYKTGSIKYREELKMKYKNIIFDFGNVIGKFKGDYILGKFASTPEDFDILADAIFKNWVALDAGTIDYDQNAEDTIAGLPDHLKDTARDFFENWFQYVDPLPETWKFIKELKARGVPIYLLSNASTRFAERALEDHPILKEFDGIVFSAPLKMAKPGHDIYYHLFNEFNLLPRECFFIDDTVENVIASKELGMESILFTGDIDAVKRAIEF